MDTPPYPHGYTLVCILAAHAALAVTEQRLEAARHMDHDSPREELVKDGKPVEQQERVHRKGASSRTAWQRTSTLAR